MNVVDWTTVIGSAISGMFIAGAFYGALRVELRWMRHSTERNTKDVAHAHRRIDDHIGKKHTGA
ncbi:MAG: hypothetical protein COB30_015290 [Ectothiorhodospiraceae bacterium]|nr:hypothetical protein [Ectothiorhodospiraceae bacterium]